jgi:membrane protein required for colicin V production
MFIDLLFLILVVVAIFKGYQKGFIVALFSVLAFIAGIAAAMKLSVVMAVYLGKNLHIGARWLPVISWPFLCWW